jgi:hypothetical protein
MKPTRLDQRLGPVTMEQHLGLADGMSTTVAARMLTLAADLAGDALALLANGMDPRHDRDTLAHLGRAATRVEMRLAQLLVLAAQHCQDATLLDVPLAIRCNIKTAGHCRSAICDMAISAAQHGRDDRMAA